DGQRHVDIEVLWKALVDGLSSIWPPTRTIFQSEEQKTLEISLGDVWPCQYLKQHLKKDLASSSTSPSRDIEYHVACHKLTQWLCYSLMEPLQVVLNIVFDKAELLTALAEYRNGGVFI